MTSSPLLTSMASVASGVAVCTEVAEHVGPAFADSLVDQLVALLDQIVFTAAVPGQIGGVGHVNEQPHSY